MLSHGDDKYINLSEKMMYFLDFIFNFIDDKTYKNQKKLFSKQGW